MLSTSGLFLLAGAQFLAAGTVIVYAGAIIVTFLFVIMLAQIGGRAAYDRMARAAGPADADLLPAALGLALRALLGPCSADPAATRATPDAADRAGSRRRSIPAAERRRPSTARPAARSSTASVPADASGRPSGRRPERRRRRTSPAWAGRSTPTT